MQARVVSSKCQKRPRGNVKAIRKIGIMVRVYSNDPGDRVSILGRVLPKTKKKMVLDTSLFNIQHYKVRIKSKWNNPGKGVALSPTHWCGSFWKGTLRATLDNGQPTYIYIYIYRERERENERVCACRVPLHGHYSVPPS